MCDLPPGLPPHVTGIVDPGPTKPTPEGRLRLAVALRSALDGLDLLTAACALLCPECAANLRRDVARDPGHDELSTIRRDGGNALLGALLDSEAGCELRYLPPGLGSDFTRVTAAAIEQLNFFGLDLAKRQIETKEGRFPARIFTKPSATGPMTEKAEDAAAAAEPVSQPQVVDTTPVRPASRGRGGRRPGSGSIDDTELLREMLRLLAEGALSANAAAVVVARSSHGQSPGAVKERIYKKFRREIGVDLPQGKRWSDIGIEFERDHPKRTHTI
jgi:hypothetical protein